MSTQRHVIQRQIVEITLAKKESAWELQQALSRILQQRLPPLLDRCLSEVSSPDYLHRIDRLELDLGELDSCSLEADILGRIELSLRQALGEHLDGIASVNPQKNDSMVSYLELLEYFVSEGYLPWWADNSQRQLPEKSFAVLLNRDPNGLKQLLFRLVKEPRCLQRLIGYFDDNHLIAITALLAGVGEEPVAALAGMLFAVQAPLHRLSRVPVAHSRAALWQSLLQVARTGIPAISRHAEFLTAVTARWAKLQNLPHTVLAGCLQELAASPAAANNQWFQTAKLSAALTFAEESTGVNSATPDPLLVAKSQLTSEISALSPIKDTAGNRINHSSRPVLAAISSRYAIVKKTRRAQSKSGGESPTVSDTEVSDDNPMTDRLSPLSVNGKKAIVNKPGLKQSQSKDETAFLVQATNRLSKSAAARRRTVSIMSSRYTIPNKLSGLPLRPANELPIVSRNKQSVIDDLVAGGNDAPVNRPDSAAFQRKHELSVPDAIAVGSLSNRYRLAYGSSRRRHEILKSNDTVSQQKSVGIPPLAESVNIKQPLREPEKNDSREERADIEQPSARSSFSDTDAVYINNAGLCLLWPFLTTFFERLELMQNGRFYNSPAKQCAISLLHYLAAEELDPPEYLLPFNKLLCAMEIDEVFTLETQLTTAQTEACDELLSAVIGYAPILNDMSINGFRGSFLLRRGSLSTDTGSWLLRVERETYDVVLERFPWSWQWFKLPWMEYPIRVEW